ncbi:pseudouridine synthase [Mycoplasmopsis iners]|uniref:pseudouridine synthase n=1 Tax=Mycoplasmopsis iners TaxID=76630 RepID=UPI0004955102|nr:pseudouridine synthase [Mycoplasmopsis iners]
MKIERVISNYTEYSRKEIKKLIKQGKVKVNQQIITESINFDLDNDKLIIDEKAYETAKFVYLAMNKPKGVVCSHDIKEGKTIYSLLPEKYQYIKNLNTFGRLDKDTTGLIIISNDGELNHKLTSDKHHVQKTYLVKLDQDFKKTDQEIIEKGIDIGEKDLTKPAELIIRDTGMVELTIQEGKYHQVKRMFKKLNYEVIELHRIKFGNLSLNDLKEGEVIKISHSQLIKENN